MTEFKIFAAGVGLVTAAILMVMVGYGAIFRDTDSERLMGLTAVAVFIILFSVAGLS